MWWEDTSANRELLGRSSTMGRNTARIMKTPRSHFLWRPHLSSVIQSDYTHKHTERCLMHYNSHKALEIWLMEGIMPEEPFSSPRRPLISHNYPARTMCCDVSHLHIQSVVYTHDSSQNTRLYQYTWVSVAAVNFKLCSNPRPLDGSVVIHLQLFDSSTPTDS